ncbi:glycosyltransferase [uncultured Vagococcus sp.]|uniref:glycosyltransferase family 2 protein n=1 Tax=uncultured Vagococcus sp. TaxID=189676 RepID=UPI0028D12636|nr:glycosyltransferase [uncultured Vagococcus sp.]
MILISALVSIIIPVNNAEQTIQRAIASCLNQSYEEIEVIIIDNRSTDQTAQIIKSNTDPRIVYVYSEKKGRSLARNMGLDRAKGHYIQFLDADDELSKTKVEVGVTYLEEKLEMQAHVSGVNYIKDTQEVAKIWPKLYYRDELLAHNIFPIHAVLFRKNKHKKVTFNVGIEYCEDWLFWVQELYGKRIYFDESYIGATVHIHDTNTMGQRERMNEYQLYVQQKIKEEYPIKSKRLYINEIKLLVIHYFTQEKEQVTIDILEKNSAKQYRLISALLLLPLVRQFARKKAQALADKNLY